MTQGKADKQAGEKLFNALRELEVQFLNGGYSVQTSAQKLLRDHGYTPVNQMAKYLIAQSILKKDEESSTHKKPYYWYNGEKLSVKYCNSLILQMKLDRSANNKTPQGAPFDEKVEVLDENPFSIHKDPYGRDERSLSEMRRDRIKELDKEIEDLKESLKMRDVEIDNWKGQFKSSRGLVGEWRAEAEKWIVNAEKLKAENMRLTKKIKKIKKLLKAVL